MTAAWSVRRVLNRILLFILFSPGHDRASRGGRLITERRRPLAVTNQSLVRFALNASTKAHPARMPAVATQSLRSANSESDAGSVLRERGSLTPHVKIMRPVPGSGPVPTEEAVGTTRLLPWMTSPTNNITGWFRARP